MCPQQSVSIGFGSRERLLTAPIFTITKFFTIDMRLSLNGHSPTVRVGGMMVHSTDVQDRVPLCELCVPLACP